MKKTILMLCVASALTLTTTYAQDQPKQDKQKTETGDEKTKVKPKTTVKDKAHNVIHPKDKRSHGTKAKTKTDAGKVKTETPAKQ
jgi:protein involved in sex pheromone biosynthesis